MKNNSEAAATIAALLSYSPTLRKTKIQDVLLEFSNPLKNKFEDRSLWLRFGLTISLSRESPRSAIQAFNECLRIDPHDPLPAMLAAKLMLEDLDDPQGGLELIEDAIERCQRLMKPETQTILGTISCYKNLNAILSKSYLLASIMHAHIYEREPESIKEFKISNLKSSLQYLDSAMETYSDDYLARFHKALHEAKQKSFASSIDNLRESIKLNPHHVPSLQLLILSLSAMKLYNEALVLCESALHEFEDNILLLYIKCNLEQRLVETKGFKSALETAQHILRCIRRSSSLSLSSMNGEKDHSQDVKQTTNLFADDKFKKSQRELLTGELAIWLLVAEIFIKIGSIKDAELCVDEGSSHANGALSYQLMFVRGLIAKAKNNLGEAKSFFQSCLALCPKHANALQQVAHVHYQLGNYSTAEKFLKDSIDVDSSCHQSWHYLSLVFIETNQHDKASDCVKKATSLEETSPIIPISAIPRLTLE